MSSDVKAFIDCYVEVFKTLYDVLPEKYVTNQIYEASKQDYHQKVQELLNDTQNILLVSMQKEEITGIAWGKVKDRASWLGFMGVKRRHRRKGVGRSLLHRFIGESVARGACKISLDTDPSLIPAIRLYEKDQYPN